MAHSEACQLFIEEQIKEGLEAGKTPYSIGKELTVMIEKMFEASIPHKTLETRAYREKCKTTSNEVKPPTPPNNSEIPENQVEHGGKREGAGRKPKYEKEVDMKGMAREKVAKNQCPKADPFKTEAEYYRSLAISSLKSISPNNPKRKETLLYVLNWIQKQLKEN